MSRKSSSRRRQRLYLQTGNILPEGYALKETYRSTGLAWPRLLLLYGLGITLFLLSGWLFLGLALQLRPEIGPALLDLAEKSRPLLIAGNLASVVVFIVLHEWAHGLFIYLYTRSRPVYGLRRYYAFAAAPGWYFPQGDYTVIALAPFVLISILGFLAALALPPVLAPALLFGLAANAAGSIGDLSVVAWLLRKSSRVLVEDVGDEVRLYWA
jgi:hypothetical protein